MKCDFCSAEPALEGFITPDFVLQEVPGVQRVSVGGWAACKECAALVHAGDEKAVAERSLKRLREINPRWRQAPYAQARQVLEQSRQRFWVVWNALPEAEREIRPLSEA